MSYARIKEILIAAREVPEERRAAYIREACGHDGDLLAEVESLLAHDVADPGLLGTGALAGSIREALAAAGPHSVAPPAHPDRIGPYRILGVLGEGGMGIVFLAEQTEPIRREVALKLIRRGFDTDRVVARFESERQSLALMDHPHIARVLDAGADASGRPYFVMERVSGVPVTTFADERRLSVRDRLELFLRICRGVHHAHQRGVIHRDLKPSNVLVSLQDGVPVPKIIDFGIAKATGERDPADPRLTLEGALVGTPEYMSPEQAGSRPGVDTRTDVYSLGVLLYELLTGHRPYRLTGRPAPEIPRAILEEEPGRPSTAVTRTEAAAAARRTTTARLQRELRGDLDTIVLMALRKEPERRYASVEHLAEDIQRYITGHPVAARKDSWRYRSAKFVRRHRVAVGAAAALVAWLGGAAIMLSFQSARVARERDRALGAEAKAKTEAATARQVSDFLVGLFGVANPDSSRGNAVTAREILDRGAQRVRQDLHGEPVVRARMMATIGDSYLGLGLYEAARGLAEEALRLRREKLGTSHPDVAASLDQLGTITHDVGELEDSERFYREALAVRRAALGDSSAEVAASLRNLAVTLQAKGDLEGAEPLYRSALALDRRISGPEHVEVAWDMNSLAWCLHQQAKYDEAEPLYRQAIALQRRLLGDRHPDVAGTLNNLAGVRWHRGDYAQSEALWREALATYRALYPEGHVALARAEYNLARSLRASGKLREAEALYRSSLAQVRRLAGERHPSYATHLYGLGVVLCDQRRVSEAEPLLAGALALRQQIYGANHPNVAVSLESMGDLALAKHEAVAAERRFDQARAIREKRQAAGHPERAIPLIGIARARLLRGDAAGASQAAIEADSLRRAALGPEHPLSRESGAVRREAQVAVAAGGD